MTKNPTVIVVACPDQGAGNDPEVLGLAFHQGSSFITNLEKIKVMFSVHEIVYLSVWLSVCLLVCLSVRNITQKVINGLE